MALTFSGTAQYLNRGSAVATAYPFSMGCWFNASSLTTLSVLISLGTATNTDSSEIFVNTTGTVAAQTRVASSGASATTVATIATGAWHHVLGVFLNATSRTIYLDGANSVNNATSKVIGTVYTNTRIGAQTDALDPAAGTIAWPAIWSAGLSATEAAALGAGLHPIRMHPEALLLAPPLLGLSPEIDLVSATTLALVGAPTLAANPRIYPYRGMITPPKGPIQMVASAIGHAANVANLTVTHALVASAIGHAANLASLTVTGSGPSPIQESIFATWFGINRLGRTD